MPNEVSLELINHNISYFFPSFYVFFKTCEQIAHILILSMHKSDPYFWLTKLRMISEDD